MATAPVTGTIAPAALTGDVSTAAPGSTAAGFGYVGVWAKDAATCAALGDPATTGFAVITASSFRDSPLAANGTFAAAGADGSVTLQAGSRMVNIAQASPDSITVDGVSMVRCKP